MVAVLIILWLLGLFNTMRLSRDMLAMQNPAYTKRTLRDRIGAAMSYLFWPIDSLMFCVMRMKKLVTSYWRM